MTILQSGPRLLPRTEPFAHELVAERLEQAGVSVRTNAKVERVERATVNDAGVGRIHGGPVTVTVDGEELVVDEVLVAAGAPRRRRTSAWTRSGSANWPSSGRTSRSTSS